MKLTVIKKEPSPANNGEIIFGHRVRCGGSVQAPFTCSLCSSRAVQCFFMHHCVQLAQHWVEADGFILILQMRKRISEMLSNMPRSQRNRWQEPKYEPRCVWLQNPLYPHHTSFHAGLTALVVGLVPSIPEGGYFRILWRGKRIVYSDAQYMAWELHASDEMVRWAYVRVYIYTATSWDYR